MDLKRLEILTRELLSLTRETEWVEFKHNHLSPEEIGRYLSALSNGACLQRQEYGYLLFGINDASYEILGTDFSPSKQKVKNEELENWLVNRLSPKIDFQIEEYNVGEKKLALFVVPAAHNQPVEFLNMPYVRVGSATRKLSDFPEKAKKIWRGKKEKSFELQVAMEHLSTSEVVALLDTQSYFELMNQPYPSDQEGVLQKFLSEKLVTKSKTGYSITNLGAILFAKKLSSFEGMDRKAVRVIVYKGVNKVETIREQFGTRGYAVGFEGLVNWINDQLPSNEEIGRAFREQTAMYPEIAIRELVANALIHQDFDEKGRPMIEIFADRVEISNSGVPLITPDRFIDEYQSRNDRLADMMRRIGICEEKGSGIDKVIFHSELYQLPAPDFVVQERHTKVSLFAYSRLEKMDSKARIRASYQHACLRHVSNE